MQKFTNLLISGMVTGAIYSVMASCLVLTYETSGIFNFAQAAVAFACAYVYYELNTGQSIPIVPAAVVTVLVFAPLLGLALNRLVFGRLASAPVYARVVGAIGVLIALPNFALWLVSAVLNAWLGFDLADLTRGGTNAGFGVPGIGPTPPKVFDLGWMGLSTVHITSDQVAVFIVAALVAVALYVVIRRTRIGLEMRAQVDRAPLAALRGIDPGRTSTIAWMLSVMLAGLVGILIAPLFHLDNGSFVLVVFASLPAVAIAGMRSIPVAFAGGLGLGVLQNFVAGYKTAILPNFLNKLTGLDAAIPYLLLIVALVFLGRQRGRAAGSMADDQPEPDHRTSLPSWRRKLPWLIVGSLLTLYAVGALPWPTNPFYVRTNILAPGLALAIVFLSFVVVTGIGGMASLAQATFVTAGGFAAGWALQTADANHPPPWARWSVEIPFVLHNGKLNFVLACLVGSVAAAILGGLIAVCVRRMGPLELALATFALAWVVYFLVFQNDTLSNTTYGYTFTAPKLNLLGILSFDFASPSQLVCMMLAVFGLFTLLIHNLQQSPWGRAMYAVRSSPVASETSGISTARAQIAIFALSAGIAGFGGALYGLTSITITRDTAPPLIGLIWLAVAVTFGVRRPGGALLAGLTFTAGAEIWHEISIQPWMPSVVEKLTTSPFFLPMLFGLGAVNLAKNPDGILAMAGHNQLEKRRAKTRERAARAAALREGSSGALETTGARASTPEGSDHEARLVFRNLVAGYGDIEVLHGVTLSVRPGEIVAVLGRNGAGKTTLCNVAAGAVALSSGAVEVDGEDVSSMPVFERARRGLLLVPEARGIFPGLTVEENLRVLLREPALRDLAYERFPILGERTDEVAGLLSGGQQQMLSLAPALASPPKVLIADEPTLGLAPFAADIVLDALRDLRDAGTAILLAEEKASEVMRVADVVCVIELGEVAWIRPCAQVTQDELAAVYLSAGAALVGRPDGPPAVAPHPQDT